MLPNVVRGGARNSCGVERFGDPCLTTRPPRRRTRSAGPTTECTGCCRCTFLMLVLLVARAGLRLVLLVLGVVSRLVVGRYGTAAATGLVGRGLLARLTTAVLVRLSTLAAPDLGLLGLRHRRPPGRLPR